MRHTGHISLVAFLALGTACATAPSGRVYEAPAKLMAADRDGLVDAVLELAASQGWEIVQVDQGRGAIEALTEERTISGVVMRDRWRFVAVDFELRVEKRLEAKFDPSDVAWESSDRVCDTYEYADEEEQLAAINRLLKSGGAEIALGVMRNPITGGSAR